MCRIRSYSSNSEMRPLTDVNPALNQPVRSYPVRPYNEPAVFVLGDRHGQKVYPGGAPPDRGASIPPGMAMPFGNPQAMLAQQNSNMEALERRGGRERDRSGSMATVSAHSYSCTCKFDRINSSRGQTNNSHNRGLRRRKMTKARAFPSGRSL